MLVSLTVGKVDAGVAVLLTEDKRLIEFPSILLPSDIQSGSIVDINVARNQEAESIADQKFSALQSEIFSTFGSKSPSPPVLRCRNATQTSIVLEWDPVELATAEFRSLSLYRNGTKAGNIPRDKLSTKISGLALDTEYTFHLVLRTSAGQYSSEKVAIKTHKMTDLHGITITPGIMPGQLKESLAETVNKIGAKMIDTVRIDTTHFVCTEPRGQAWEKAVEMNVPVVVPDWVKGCEREGRIVGVRGYYLDADPKLRQMGPSTHQQRGSVSSANVPMRDSPRIEHTPPTPERPTHSRGEESDTAATAATQSVPQPPPKSPENPDAEQDAQGNFTSAKPVDGADSEDDDSEEEEDHEAEDPEKAKNHDEESDDEPGPSASKAPQTPGEDGKFDEVEL
ncbi:Cell fusion protein cfr1 [Pseudocercospora fuligena]|uniref:Cell fusion protein cfr1 n=1 Tax=Pseudocercospora fuligena TaxID=685502 RepID=A0A8H6RBE9_9PEZI|nr:Cell fusion protein cfr1 [Pseudocercospora fuligena]